MGNIQGMQGLRVIPKCPSPFVSLDALSCVMQCPQDKKFEREGGPNGHKCVYWPNKSFSVNLETVGATVFEGGGLEELRTEDPTKYSEFSTVKDKFDRDIAVIYSNIDSQQKIDDAFKDLQAAENARDQNPEAYQLARTAYYTLIKGDSWKDEERQRIAVSQVTPELDKYRTTVSSVANQNQEQQKTIDIVSGVRDKVLSLKDDFKYSVDTLSNQVEKVKTQLNMENRSREKEVDNTWVWVDWILNILLVVALVYTAYVLYRKVYTTPVAPTYTVQT